MIGLGSDKKWKKRSLVEGSEIINDFHFLGFMIGISWCSGRGTLWCRWDRRPQCQSSRVRQIARRTLKFSHKFSYSVTSITVVVFPFKRYPDIVMTITFGDFGDADDEVVNAAGGQTKYNVEVSEFSKYKTLVTVPPLFIKIHARPSLFSSSLIFDIWSSIFKWSTTSQMRYEAFGLSPVDYGVMNPTGEKFAFKSMSVFIAIMMLVQRPWSRFINELATKK